MKRFSIASIWGSAWAPIGSVVLALIIAGVMMAATNSNPLDAYRALFEGAFTRPGTDTRPTAFFETLVSATPFLILALGISLSFSAGLFN
ncbi:MAG: hypothetical protein ABIV92_19585, partial [Thermoflexales bacterium]